ncbi:hypothetical protein MC5_07485 (plasmid) [Rickettsia australis str. Cutlack]|uniref:Uncharacterized protein n=1 Tax=Rickettsia australis (strain Cutlack) TaxID=1105110 RepID=H8K9Z7_RICAC|nr:hypothetical protein MC5_07485 [Rickettsia australis str. Cutlack]
MLSPSAEIIIYITKIIVSIITGITHIESNVNINNIMLEYTICVYSVLFKISTQRTDIISL